MIRALGRILETVARRERSILVAAFLAAATALCLFLTFTSPIGQVPDEHAHALRADSLRRGTLIGSRWETAPMIVPREQAPRATVIGQDAQGRTMVSMPWWVAGGPADPGLRTAALHFHFLKHDQKVNAGDLQAVRAIPWGEPVPTDFPNTTQYAPTLYIGAALGLSIAQGLGFGPYDAMIGARLANVAQFLVMGGLALWLATAGRLLLFAVLTLPMTLFMTSSISQDGPMIAAAALAAALASRLWLQPAPPPGRLVVLALILIAVITARPTNAPLALLLLLPQPGIDWRPRIVAFTAVTLATIAWSAIIAAYVAVPLRPGADLAQQLAEMRQYPKLFFVATWIAFSNFWPSFLGEIIGKFGMLDVLLPTWVPPLFAIPFSIALLGDITQPTTGPRLRLPGVVAILAISCGLIALAQYLTWTLVGEKVLEGVQGRYFLPLFTIVGLGVAGLLPIAARWPRGLAVLGTLTCPAISLLTVPSVILTRYYGP